MMGKRRRRVYLVINRDKEERNGLRQAAAAVAAKDGRCRRHPGASLLHHICDPHRLSVACPPSLHESGHGESVFYGSAREGCLAQLATAAPGQCARIIWYNTSRSDVANRTWRQHMNLIVNSALSLLLRLDFPCRLGLRACSLQRASSAVV